MKTAEKEVAEGVYYCMPINTRNKVFCLDKLKKLRKEWTGGSYIFMKSNPRVIGDRPLLSIGYKYNCMKVLVSIATERTLGTEPGDPCLSRFPVMYSNVYVLSVFFPQFLGNNFDACNVIYNHNSMRQSDLAVDK